MDNGIVRDALREKKRNHVGKIHKRHPHTPHLGISEFFNQFLVIFLPFCNLLKSLKYSSIMIWMIQEIVSHLHRVIFLHKSNKAGIIQVDLKRTIPIPMFNQNYRILSPSPLCPKQSTLIIIYLEIAIGCPASSLVGLLVPGRLSICICIFVFVYLYL